MRLFLVPISTRRTLIYGQRLHQVTHSSPSLADKASAKASKIWFNWENGNKKWQKSITEAGNKLLSRIPYEEWGLKSIPPLSARRERAEVEGKKIDVIYPPSAIEEKNIPTILRKLATERTQLHRSRMIWSIVGMPIVSPLALVPIVPNIPFFYLLYRAFSHWKALAGGKHLEFLVNRNLFNPTPSRELDLVYSRKSPTLLQDKKEVVDETNVRGDDNANEDLQQEVMLISEKDAKEIAAAINLPPLAAECERACQQVEKHLKDEAEKQAQTKKSSQ